MSKLLEYFNVVDKNAAARAAHQAAPMASMAEFGLTTDEQQAVLSGDKDSLAQAMEIAFVDIPVVHVPNTIFTDSGRASSGEFPTLHTPLTYFLN